MNKVKGDKYELQIKNYIINQLNKEAFLWSETPETLLINYGIIGSHNQHRLRRIESKENNLIDTGIDIIQIEENLCSLVQCKNGYKNGITINDLAGFMCWMSGLTNLTGYVYYTNKLSTNVKELPNPTQRIKYIKQKYNENTEIQEVKFTPYNYQLKAQEEFNNNFINRGILSLPCGTGKTLICYLCANKYKQIIILSPLKQFAKQNLDKFIEYGYNNKTLLVDSDGERDLEEVNKFIKSNDSFLISSTFCSIDIISKCKFDNPLFIIDEFHNLSKNNIINEYDDFYKLLNSNYKILFVSATPRVYELEDFEDTIDEDLFGPIIYNMTFTEAITNKYITDYKIWLPSIHEDNNQLDKELSIYEIDSVIKAKCKYFYSCLLNNGSRKCIIYCIDTKEITLMLHGMKILNEFYALDYITNQITANNTEKERSKILNDFATNNIIQLLFSVRILDECIDIPKCDSIFITYPSKSKIRTIQRLCRCIRIDKTNKFKIGNIYIWCDKYDEILETLSGIKEYDLFFKDKIMINQTNFFGDSVITEFNNDKKVIEKYIIGIKEFKQLSWHDKLKLVEQYIIDNNKTPSSESKDKTIKILGVWLLGQKNSYKNRIYIMKQENIRKDFEKFTEKYQEHFLTNKEQWLKYLRAVEEYIKENNKRPSITDKNKNVKQLGVWISTNTNRYKKNDKIMKDDLTRNEWEKFIKSHEKYFKSNDQIWFDNLNLVEEYIIKNNKRPSNKDKNIDIKFLGNFITHQKNNDKIAKNPEMQEKWIEFNNKFQDYFKDNETCWMNTLKLLELYIIENNKLPTKKNDKLGIWLCCQKKNHKNKEDIMKNENIRKIFEDFIDKHQQFFRSNEEDWLYNLKLLQEYLIKENKTPSQKDENKDIRSLSRWVTTQNVSYRDNKYIMATNTNVNKQWKEFIKLNEKFFK
jgi:superfamily II DNA or RNA helicase